MPNERARALRWAGEFIRELAAYGEISEARKREAQVILRHYPSTAEIDAQTRSGDREKKLVGPWLSPETAQPEAGLSSLFTDDIMHSLEDLKAGRVAAYNFGNTQRAEEYDDPRKMFEGD